MVCGDAFRPSASQGSAHSLSVTSGGGLASGSVCWLGGELLFQLPELVADRGLGPAADLSLDPLMSFGVTDI